MEQNETIRFEHRPVLLDECLAALNIRADGIYADGTLGGAGHSSEILARLGPEGLLIGIDQDTNALQVSEERLAQVSGGQFRLVHSNFSQINQILTDLRIEGIDGMLMDIGVSSHQLDEAERGFSYQHDAPLDMRMDRRQELDAATIVNQFSEEKISRIISEFGEERWAKRIASIIVRERSKYRIETTVQLSDVIKMAIPAAARREGPHPAKRTFQAIRIAVNDELGVLEHAIDAAFARLNIGGRLAIITFHSLEDRIVKQKFAQLATGCTCPKEFPVCICGKKPAGQLVNRKPVVAGEQELEENPRARSAKLRTIEKIR